MSSIWVASRARTIPFPVPGDCALHGITVRPFPRAWPEKSAGDALDFSVDYTAWLADIMDTISKIAVDDVSEVPATGLTVDWAAFVDGIVSVGVSGGQSGLRYRLRIAVTTATGRTISSIFILPVSIMSPTVAASSLPAPDLTFPAGTITINGTPNT